MRATEEKKNSFLLYDSYRTTFQEMSDSEAGQMIKAIFDYNATGKERKMSDSLKYPYKIIIERMSKDRQAYIAKCEQNAEIAKRKRQSPNDTER